MTVAGHDRPAASSGELTGWLPREDVPVLINSFNRLDCLRELVTWLLRAGQRRLFVVDNGSTYPPLLAYLARLESTRAATVVRLGGNHGHLALWNQGVLHRLGIETEYVYTDPDVVPAGACPPDLIAHLQRILALDPAVAAAGPGLHLDDLPDGYRFKREAITWERQFWLAPAAAGLFHAPIDTTFALYRPGSGHCLRRPAIRTGWPYLAAHRGWYTREDRLTDEDRYYREVATPSTSHWSVPALPDRLAAAIMARGAAQPALALVAASGLALPGYRALGPDDAASLPASSLDGAYALDALDRLAGEPALGRALHRALKPDARLVVHTGHLPAAAARAILAQEPQWMDGWRLRRAVAAGADPRDGAADVDALMLHLEPAPAAVKPGSPEILFDRLDCWPGFTVVQ